MSLNSYLIKSNQILNQILVSFDSFSPPYAITDPSAGSSWWRAACSSSSSTSTCTSSSPLCSVYRPLRRRDRSCSDRFLCGCAANVLVRSLLSCHGSGACRLSTASVPVTLALLTFSPLVSPPPTIALPSYLRPHLCPRPPAEGTGVFLSVTWFLVRETADWAFVLQVSIVQMLELYIKTMRCATRQRTHACKTKLTDPTDRHLSVGTTLMALNPVIIR